MKSKAYTTAEDTLLVNIINGSINSRGQIQWMNMEPMSGRDIKSMSNRWQVIRPGYDYEHKGYALKMARQGYRTRRLDVQEYLDENPNEKPKVVAEKLGLNINTVYSARREATLRAIKNVVDNTTPTPKVDDARTTPQIKSVKISRSFLWGAIKYERYE